ncbi:unnamed protein product [Sphagnum balticum]
MRGSGTYKEKERQKAVLSGGVLEAAGDGSGKRVSEAAGDGFAKGLQVMGAVENPVKCEASKKVPKG